jgi:putative transposase
MIGGKFKHPRFKNKKSNNFSYREVMISENCFDFDHRTLNIPKLKKVKFKLRLLPKNFIIKSVKNITVKKTPSGKYFASLCCEVEYSESTYRHENQMSAIGLDWSPKTLFVADDGKTGCDYNYVTFKQKSSKKLHMLQKRMMKKQKGSKNRDKARVKVARLEEYIANQRKDFLHKKSNEMTNQHDLICTEDLNMKSISNKGFHNGKATMDNGYGMFANMMKYKQQRKGHYFIKIDKFYPSSQLCSCCNHRQPMPLYVRTYKCPNCGMVMNRDENAAVNIRNEGYRLFLEQIA